MKGEPVSRDAQGRAARAEARRFAVLTDMARGPERLLRSQLGVVDIAASTMANIAPAMSFYFGFGFLAVTAGVASPLTILVAAVAVMFLGNTLAEFARAHPSTGSFITFIGKAFGPTSAVATSILLIAGYVVAIIAVIAMSGGFTAIFINHYVPSVPLSVWPLFAVGFVVLGGYLMVRGVHISTRWAGTFFAVEMTVLVLVSCLALIQHRHDLSLHPFEPAYLASGFRGLGLGFPLAVYMFVGWENSASLAEETEEPRRNVPRAIFTSIAAMAAGYLLFAYATVEGFRENVTALSDAPIAFITLADGVLGGVALFAYLAGVTSTVACVIAAVNSQSRLLFNGGREGLLPSWLGRVYARRGTPVNALLAFMGLGLLLVFAWSTGQHIGPTTLFAEASTLGTMMILVVYFTANLALPVYYRRFRPAEFSVVRHVVMPLVGAVAIAVPIYELFNPSIAAPYDWFPYITAAVIACALVYAVWLNAHDTTLAERVGSLVADEPPDGKFAVALDDAGGESVDASLRRIVDVLAVDGPPVAALGEALRCAAEALAMDSAAVFAGGGGGTARLVVSCGEVRRRSACPPLSLPDPVLPAAGAEPKVITADGAAGLPEALQAVACRRVGSLVVAAALDCGAILVLSRRSTEDLVAGEMAYIGSVTRVFALALRNRTLSEEVERSETVLQTAYAVARAITQSLDLESTYQEIVAGAARVVSGSRCVLFESERGSDELVAAAASGPDRDEVLRLRVRLVGAGGGALDGGVLPGTALQEVSGAASTSLSVNKFGSGGHGGSPFMASLSPEASIAVPLVANHELVGSLLVCASRWRRRFSPAEVDELRAVGEQAAISIQNARLFHDLEASQSRVEALLDRLTRLREHERQSLARIVHDDVMQSIVGATYRLESLREDLPISQTTAFDEALAVLRQSVKDARRVIWGLRPPSLDGLGLPEALMALAKRARRQSEAEVVDAIATVRDIREPVTTALYTIAREALLNAVNHAEASRIRLSLAEEDAEGDRRVRLLVEDDGVGFDSAAAGDGGGDHYGLLMMEEQARLISARFGLRSDVGRGTSIEVVAPFHAKEACT